MSAHEDKIEILKNYSSRIGTFHNFRYDGEIPPKQLENALRSFARDVDVSTILGLYDITIVENGKCGYLFTENGLYFKDTFTGSVSVSFKNIDLLSVNGDSLIFTMRNGSSRHIDNAFSDKNALYDYINAIIEYNREHELAVTDVVRKSPEYYKKLDILKKYYLSIGTAYGFDTIENIAPGKLDAALGGFASGADRNDVLGYYDTSVTGRNAKGGYLFTDTKIYYKEMFGKPKKIWYDDITGMEIGNTEAVNDCDKTLIIHLYKEDDVVISNPQLNKTPLLNMLTEIVAVDSTDDNSNLSTVRTPRQAAGAEAAGEMLGNYSTVNKLFEEERFNASMGHGFAAERANNLYDNLTGHHAEIVGDDNAKNGADRIVDGVLVQTKYCSSGSACIEKCFDKEGNFRYTINNGTDVMQIEVPSDKYAEAVEVMRKRISQGKVPGHTNPDDASKIVRKGHFTYAQARNIAKAGNIDSITYDSVNGVISAVPTLGLTFIMTYATSVWNGDAPDIALKTSIYSGLKVGGVTFITSVLSSQIGRTAVNSFLVGGTEAIVRVMGPKASAVIVNAFRSGSKIYGAAAMKSAAKLLRGNIITSGVTVVVLSTFDIVDIFRGRISGAQLFKNITNTTASVAGGAAGWVGGAALGSAILPGVGTVIGGIAGSFAAGGLAGKASNAVLDNFVKDDAEALVKIFEERFSVLAQDYLLSRKEAEKVADRLKDKLDGKTLKDMYASEDKTQFADDILIDIIEQQVSKRKPIHLPSDDMILDGLREILENIADCENAS